MSDKLATELISAANGDGGAIKKKDDTHRWQMRIRHLHILDK